MNKFCVIAIAWLMTTAAQAESLAGRTVAVASFFGDTFMMMIHDSPVIFKTTNAVVPALNFDAQFSRRLADRLSAKFSAQASPLADTTVLPSTMKFGSFGPDDDEKLGLIYKAGVDADFLLVFYPGESAIVQNVRGGAFVTTNISLDHVTLIMEALLIDLKAKKIAMYDTVVEIENYSFSRAPLEPELAVLQKEILEGVAKPEARKQLMQVIYAKPFNKNAIVTTYEKLVSPNDDELDDIDASIRYITLSITPELAQYQAEELTQIRKFVYAAMDDAIPGILNTIEESLNEEF